MNMSKFKAKLKVWKGAKKTNPKPIKGNKLPKGKGSPEEIKKPGVKTGYKVEKKKEVKGLKSPEKSPEKKKSLDESINMDMDKFNSLVKRLDEEFAKELEANDDLAELAAEGDEGDVDGTGEIGAEENSVTITLSPEQLSCLRAILAQVDGQEGDEGLGDEHAEPDADDFGGESDNDADNLGVTDEDEEEMKKVAKVSNNSPAPKTNTVKPLGNQGLKKEPFKTTTPVKAPTAKK